MRIQRFKSEVITYTLITHAAPPNFNEIEEVIKDIDGYNPRPQDKIIIEFIGSSGTADPLDYLTLIKLERKVKLNEN